MSKISFFREVLEGRILRLNNAYFDPISTYLLEEVPEEIDMF